MRDSPLEAALRPKPIESGSCAAHCARGRGVHQHPIQPIIPAQLRQLLLKFWILVFIVQNAQDADSPRKLCKMFPQADRQKGVGGAVELHSGQPTSGDCRNNLVQSRVHKHSVLLQLRGQECCDFPHHINFHPPWAWSKDEADCIRAALRRKTSIFKGSVATNLDPHGHLLTGERSVAARSRVSSALPGSGWRIRDSPMRKAWNPAVRKRIRSSAVSIPLSLT